MNKSDLGTTRKKLNEEYEKHMKEYSFQSEIEKIARDIRERQDNALAMEFTKKIGQMLRDNGVVPHITEYKTEMECTENSVKQRYGVEFDSLDFTEHDRPFKSEITQLKYDLEEMEKKANVLEENYKREREVINNLYRRCSKRAGTTFKDKKYDYLQIVTNEELKSTPEKPEMYAFSIREIGGEVYIRYSDYEWYNKGKENEIKELESKIKELESELSVKENLLKIKNGLCGENDLSGLTPVEVAEKPINAESEYETNSIERAFGAKEKEKYNIFSTSDLKQIAEHLLVYCNHNSEDVED